MVVAIRMHNDFVLEVSFRVVIDQDHLGDVTFVLINNCKV